jgi:phosphoserine phosphatase RsbU/P
MSALIDTIHPNYDTEKITARQGGANVLIVDDDITSTRILQSILKKEGFVVITAENGITARELAIARHPDLILLDIHMPGEDGFSICADLKSKSNTSEIPIIFISSNEDVKSKIAGFDVGGVDYITKPYHPQEVLARVRLHIRMQRMVTSYLKQLSTLSYSQQDLLPKPGVFPDANFNAIYFPAYFAGGDFYDVLQAGEGIHDYIVADVSGHNAGTALATSALKALLNQNAQMLYSPIENLKLLNSHLRSVLQEGQYISLIYARVNRVLNRVTLINAGHPPAVILRQKNAAQIINQEGDLLGIFDSVSLEVQEIFATKGDRLFLYSDGLIEQSPHGVLSRPEGLASFMELCNTTHSENLNNAITTISQNLFPVHENLLDDVVLLGLDI